jgi:hypothetical protein
VTRKAHNKRQAARRLDGDVDIEVICEAQEDDTDGLLEADGFVQLCVIDEKTEPERKSLRRT